MTRNAQEQGALYFIAWSLADTADDDHPWLVWKRGVMPEDKLAARAIGNVCLGRVVAALSSY